MSDAAPTPPIPTPGAVKIEEATPQDHVVSALTGLLSKFRDEIILPLVDRIDKLEQSVAASPVLADVEQAVDVAEEIERSGAEIIDAMSKGTPPPQSV